VESVLRFHIDERPSIADVTHSLTIEPTEPEDAGRVKAVAVNKAGEATTEAKLIIDGLLFYIFLLFFCFFLSFFFFNSFSFFFFLSLFFFLYFFLSFFLFFYFFIFCLY
jgi:hypothetical protein